MNFKLSKIKITSFLLFALTAISTANTNLNDYIKIGGDGAEPSLSGDSIAIGKNSKTKNSIAIGLNADASLANKEINGGIAIGNNSKSGFSSVSIGSNSFSSSYSISIGENSKANLMKSIAIGKDSKAYTAGISIGENTKTGSYAISLGVNAISGNGEWNPQDKGFSGSNSIAIGFEANSNTGENSIALGSRAISGNYGISIGSNSKATIENSIALGSYSLANIESGIVGYDPKNNEEFNLQELPNYDKINEIETRISETEKILKITKEKARIAKPDIEKKLKEQISTLELMLNTDITEKNNIINTWKSTSGAVSIGNSETGITRQITGVAAGSRDTDAVNIAQLKRLEEKLKNSISSEEINLLKNDVSTANSGVSNAIAIASLTQANNNKNHNFSIAYGTYGKYHSFALGFNGKINAGNFNYKINASINNTGNLGVGVGLGYSFGNSSTTFQSKDERIKKLEQEVKELKDIIIKIQNKLK